MKPRIFSRWASQTLLFVAISMLMADCGRQQPKMYRVGILSGLDYFADTANGFKSQMTELGYVEGQNIVYDMRTTNFDPTAEKKILGTFVSDRVDLILVFPTEVALAAKAATTGTDIPVIFANANIEGVALVKSVREPGGNVTGVRYPGPDIAIRRFEIMLEFVPKAKRFWIPYQRGYPTVDSQLEVLRPAAAARGITLTEVPAANAAEIQTALSAETASGGAPPDAILLIAEALCVSPEAFETLGKFAMAHKVPIGGAPMAVGVYASIFGISTDKMAVGRQAASLAAKILNGARPATMPVVSAESFMQINCSAARNAGVKVPPGLLYQAAQIIP